MSKITLIGGGMVGQTIAQFIILKDLASEIILLDVNTQKAEGALLDIEESSPDEYKDIKCASTDDYTNIKDSDVIVITAGVTGLAPQPAAGQEVKASGWNRDSMLQSNTKIISSIAEQVKKHAPDAFVIVITNPMDSIVEIFQKISGLPHHKVVGEAGTDDNRFRYFCSKALGVSVCDVTGFVVGEHGNSMVPLFSTVTETGFPVEFTAAQKADITENVVLGAKKVIDICHISPYRTVATAAVVTIEAYLRDRNRVLSISNYDTEKGLYYSWPCVINKTGVVRRIGKTDFLTKEEQEKLCQSIAEIKATNEKAKKFL